MKRLFQIAVLLVSIATSSMAQNLDWTVSHDTLIVIQDSSAGQSIVTNPPTASTNCDSALKLIYWIHGLAGNNDSWMRVKAVTEDASTSNSIPGYPTRNAVGSLIDYSAHENGKLYDVADASQLQMVNQAMNLYLDTMAIENRIAIAHSQGGLVARRIRLLNHTLPTHKPAKFGALITFGTPHGGTVLINNSHPDTGAIVPWLSNGCTRLTEAYFQNWINYQPWYVQLLLPKDLPKGMAKSTCRGLKNTVLPFAISKIRKNVAEDYAIRSNELALLDSFSAVDTLPTIVVYGVEEEPVFWRMVNSMTLTSDSAKASSALNLNPFSIDDDHNLQVDIQGRIAFYNTLANQFGFTILSRFGFRYYYAARWLSNANVVWKRMIGARFDSVYPGDYECWCDGQKLATLPNAGDCMSYFANCIDIDVIQELTHHITEIPNDGVVTEPSQKAYPGRVIREIRMDNTNHMQMRNCQRTKEILKNVFNGYYDDLFHISIK